MGQAFHDFRHRLADHVEHQQAGDQAGQQRDDQDRLQRFHTLRQAQLAADRPGDITRQETGDDAAKEPGAGAHRQHAADQARRQARTIRDGESDETGQHRHHQREGGAAADLHQRRRQVPLTSNALMPNTNDSAMHKPPATTIGNM